jgi:hypothetical protein
MNNEHEQVLTGGVVNDVVRVGNTVRRSTGPWTPAVHALLMHLEAAGFPYSPRVLGIDDDGREVLTHIDGVPALRPWPPIMRSDDGLRALGRMLRELKLAVADFIPPHGATWRTQPVPDAESIRHGDVGPWNTIWDGDRLVGLIDWDFAEPAPSLWDIAQAAWYAVPIFGDQTRRRECGFSAEPDLRHRLNVLCEAYGTEPEPVLNALHNLQVVERQRVIELGGQGVYPFTVFYERGDVEELGAETTKLAALRSALLGT